MLGKVEIRTPPGSRPRDGRHCDLCGCSQPAVRCDKCGCQIFCLSCDDMYHRHPKRRFHLRKAVDPIPPIPQARPVLPVKVAHLNSASPGDPSKMPLPPPRKKKSLFGSFRKPSPTSDNSPPLPKKEYSWSDRLGSIKKFMSNRPLPPLPTSDDNDDQSQPTTNGQSTRGDLSFIHRRNDERPPQLPQRSPKSPDFPGISLEKENRIPSSPPHMPGQIRNGSLETNANHINQNRELPSNEEIQWNNMMNNQNGPQRFGTLNRQSHQRGFVPPGAPGYPGGMHQSSSATDLHNLQNAEGMPGSGQVPQHFPHYPMNPHMPPHYPYPMYPQFPNYPQYFGNSFANLSNPPTSEGDFSDQSEPNNRHSSKKYPFRKRAKRSQSVMMDRMAYPGQFYPFGPYPGYGPWGAPVPMEAPPSPASSVRSLSRSGRIRRRKKMTSEEDDEEFSVSSSPLSRPKSSSSDPKDPVRAPLATQTTSSEDESEGETHNRRTKRNTIQRRQSDPAKSKPPASESKRIAKLQKSSSKQSDSDIQEIPENQTERRPSRDSNEEQPVHQQPSTSSGAPDTWDCNHCTFVNPAGNRICQVCCKTATYKTETPVPTQSSPAANSRKQSVDSERGYSSPEKPPENEEDSTKKEKQDMASLNSALDEAEKQISKGLEELMKLKDDIDANMKEKSKAADDQPESASKGTSKPVYKSSGRMRSSILDKLNLNKPQTSNASVSTSTEAQTGQSNWTSDKIIEARRHSNSSTTSETYNSPIAQSPDLDRGFLGNRQKRDSSCQTQQDSIAEYLERKKAAEEAFLGRPVNNFGFGYGDRMDMVTSPVPSMYDRFFGGGYGMMQRSHSRASLFTGRMNDLGPMDYGGGFGYGPGPMYRSVSRGSLTGEYPDGRMSEFHNLRKPDFYLSMEELVERRRQENIRSQGLELVRMIREAEQQGFNADDIQVALTHCGKQNPMEWLQENWRNMVDSVVTLSTNYGNDKKENDIGLLNESEARDALRMHKGNIWAAVTECVEGRQRKYLELSARGNFSRKDIVDALTSSEGDVEMAYANLSKTTGKPFLMRIWGAGEGAQNQDGARPLPEDLHDLQQRFLKDETLNSDDLSEEIWSEDGDWDDDDEEYGEERGDIEDLQTCHEDLHTSPQEMRTPESDKSDYCDAFPVDDRNASSPSDDIFFVIPEAKPEKKKGFLSKLAALRKDSKEQASTFSNIGKAELATERSVQSKEDSTSQNSASSSEQPKNNGTLSALKNTLSAIKDTVTGGTKNDKKLPCTQPERRTIIVRGQIDHESFSNDSKDYVKLNSIKPIESDSLPTLIHEKESTKNDTLMPEKEYTTKVSPISERESAKKDTRMFESESKEMIKQLKVSVEKEETKHNDLETKPLKGDLKDNVQPDIENTFKVIESKNKVGIKRQQSLAERLKFAKQSRHVTNASNSSMVQTESTGSDVRVEGKVDSKINKENLSLDHENTTSSYVEERRGKKLESKTISQIPENIHLSTEKETKLENTKPDATQSTKFPELQNVIKEIKAQNEIVSSDPVESVDKSPDMSPKGIPKETKQANKPEPSVSETLQEKYEDSNEVKSVNKIKSLDTSPKTKTEQIPVKKEEGDKVLENMSGKADSTPREKTAEVKKQVSNANAVGDSSINNKSQQSEIKKSIIAGKSDASKDISSSSAEKLPPEIKPISSNSRKPDNTVKEGKQIAATSTASEKITTALDQRDSKINENAIADVKISTETGKSANEIIKNNVVGASIESNIPNTVMEHTNGGGLETLLNKPSESKPGSSVSTSRKENNKSQQNLTVVEDEVSNKNQNSTENAGHSSPECVEGTSSSSKDSVAVFTENNSTLDTGNLENDAIVTEVEGTIKQTETTKKLQEGKPEKILIDKSQNISPKAQVDISQGVSINRVVEQESNLPTVTSIQNSLETKVEESSTVNSNIQQESTNITLEERITPVKTLEVQVPSQNNEEQNLPDSVNETSLSNNESDSIPGNEVTVNENDVKSIPNAEATPQSSPKAEDTTLNQTAVIASVQKNDSPSASTTENTKIGKFKFSKSGKVKKTQAKDDKKDSKSHINDKNQTAAGTSLNKTTVAENDSKASTSHDDVEAKVNSSSSLIITDELIANKVLTEKAAEIEKIREESSEVESKTLPSGRDVAPVEENKKQLSESENKSFQEEAASGVSTESIKNSAVITEPESSTRVVVSNAASKSKDELSNHKMREVSETPESRQIVAGSSETSSNSTVNAEKKPPPEVELQEPVVSKEFPGNKNSLLNDAQPTSSTNVPNLSNVPAASGVHATVAEGEEKDSNVSVAPMKTEQHSNTQGSIITDTSTSVSGRTSSPDSSIFPSKSNSEMRTENEDHNTSNAPDSDISDIEYSDESRPSSITPPSPVDALRNRFEVLAGGTSVRGQTRPQSPFRRMSLNSRKQVIALEKKRDTTEKPWFHPKIVNEPVKTTYPKRSIKQQLEMERRVRQMVSDRKCRTYRKAEVVVQLMDMKFEEDEAIQAANECSTLEQAISYLQQECLLCAGHFPVSQIVSMTHCEHRACRECIRAYFTVQIRDRTILDLLCPFCNEPDIGDEDVAQDYFNHLDIMLKKLVDMEIHELFQRKLRDRVLMRDPNFRWCSQCSSGFIAMPNLKRLVCPDCNAVTCASCRRVWEREHQGISCEAFAALKDASDPETLATGLAKMLTEDGIDCPSCHFRYALAKGGCMHFRCIQCQHDFCSGCSRPFKMGQKCGVSEFCAKLGLHAHHPRNCLFYLRDKEPEDLQKLLDLSDVKYNIEAPDGVELNSTCQVMEQKETADGMVDDFCGKEVQDGYAGLCRLHYVEYLGQLVNKHKVDPIQIFENDDLELVLRRANVRLPPKRYRESEIQYREKLVNLIQEELPLDKMDGS